MQWRNWNRNARNDEIENECNDGMENERSDEMEMAMNAMMKLKSKWTQWWNWNRNERNDEIENERNKKKRKSTNLKWKERHQRIINVK